MVVQSDKRKNSVYLSLGTNLGNRLEHLNQAIAQLQLIAHEEVQVSPIYESEPWGNDSLKPFFNCVVHLSTNLDPIHLLKKTQEIEKGIGRGKKSQGTEYKNRVIDIDLLTYNNLTIDSFCLAIPHPHLTKRRFVLLPFADMAPNLLLPYSSQSIENNLLHCEDRLWCKKIKEK